MDNPVVILIAVAATVIAVVFLSWRAARKRRDALAEIAARLGLSFSRDKDHGMAHRFSFLDRLARGDNRYAFNVISGRYEGDPVFAFDYHYETRSSDSKGNRQTRHHYFSFLILTLPTEFPELTIAREGFLSKIAQAFGYDDIDFESHEFSRAFCVRSRDKRFAYDVCHARMIEYLMDNRDLSIEIEGCAIGLGFDSRLAAAEVERNLRRLRTLRTLMPNYLLTRPGRV